MSKLQLFSNFYPKKFTNAEIFWKKMKKYSSCLQKMVACFACPRLPLGFLADIW